MSDSAHITMLNVKSYLIMLIYAMIQTIRDRYWYVHTYPVGFRDLKKIVMSFKLVKGMLIRVPFHNKGFIGSADVVKRCVFRNTECLVVNSIRGARKIFVIHERGKEGEGENNGKGRQRKEKKRIGKQMEERKITSSVLCG